MEGKEERAMLELKRERSTLIETVKKKVVCCGGQTVLVIFVNCGLHVRACVCVCVSDGCRSGMFSIIIARSHLVLS